MRLASAFVGVFLLVGAANAEAGGGTGAGPTSTSACYPAGELEAAKAALARGDKQAALDHLRRADTALAQCERERAAPIPEAEEHDRALARTGRCTS